MIPNWSYNYILVLHFTRVCDAVIVYGVSKSKASTLPEATEINCLLYYCSMMSSCTRGTTLCSSSPQLVFTVLWPLWRGRPWRIHALARQLRYKLIVERGMYDKSLPLSEEVLCGHTKHSNYETLVWKQADHQKMTAKRWASLSARLWCQSAISKTNYYIMWILWRM